MAEGGHTIPLCAHKPMPRPLLRTQTSAPDHQHSTGGERGRRSPASPMLATGALLALALGGCRLEAMKAAQRELVRQGHAATVDCLQAERAITGGDDLRCEDWDYVRQNYLRPKS
jgi:hypothetical protein